MDKQKVVYTYNEILFSLKKKQNSDTCYSMDEPQKHYVKWNKSDTKGQILYNSTYTRDLEQANSQRNKIELWFPEDGREYNSRSDCLMGPEFGIRKKFWGWMMSMVTQQGECTLMTLDCINNG